MADTKRPEDDPDKGRNAPSGRQRWRAEDNSERRKHTARPEQDAAGQFARSHKGHDNSGVTSADPRVLSGKASGDATWPLKQGDES